MKVVIFDLGYGLAIVTRKSTLFRVSLPFPLRLASWKYILRGGK